MIETPTRTVRAEGAHPTLAYRGPERRRGMPMTWRCLAAALDEIDYGFLVLDATGCTLHVNHAARAQLHGDHPLQLSGRALDARDPRDAAKLQAALLGAMQRGLRKLITLGGSRAQASLSIVPVCEDGHTAALVYLGKRELCAELAVQGFARSHGLTPGETRVLEALCRDEGPVEIAEHHGVQISTVRSQIGSIREKTGAASIRALVRQVAVLPPLMGVLRDCTEYREAA